MDEKDTVEPTETDPVQPLGTAEDEPSTDSQPVQTEQEKVDKAAYEAAEQRAKDAQAELNKARQELNLRRNNEKKAELERLAAEGKDKERADALQAQLDEITAKQEAADREKEASDFRSKILDQYPESVKAIAEELSLWWDNPNDLVEAETQLKTKLDALKSRVGDGPVTDEAAPTVHANNPSVDTGETELKKLASMKADEMRKVLPIADPR